MSLFRKSSDQSSLKINTNPFETSRVRQRFSSWFRSSPTSPKSKRNSPTPVTPTLVRHPSSASLSSLSDVSDHMPASPVDNQPSLWQDHMSPVNQPSLWQKQSEQHNVLSLADQVRLVLGSALDEVDEEIEGDWEQSRAVLQQSLVLPTKERISLRL
ncbi:hypothetical protein EDC96DRAFT_504615 [Choanephora cucurbitarum]|nr:hypothetical protein EDC96DRAFT_504615 [Choanephora cucurbitarum]